ncbi:MAG: hypothetical protein OXG50_05820 [bacterium]|nr:hypothetical protein [bacterium]
MLLVRVSSGDLYVGEAGGEVGREHRVVRDSGLVSLVSVERDGVWSGGRLVGLGGELVLVAEGEDGFGVWAVEGEEFVEVVSGGEDVSAVVAGGALYVRETRDGTQRCYRGASGALDDLERVFRGDFCSVSRSGHIMGAELSGDQWRVRVWPPGSDDEVLRANFDALPAISGNGLFLVSGDEDGVAVTSVESGDRVWELGGAFGYDMMAHPAGHVALAVQAEGGEAVLVLVEADGTSTEVAEVAQGDLEAMFSAAGDLVWLHTGSDGVGELFSWSLAAGEELDLADEEDLELVGVWEDSAITVIEDDFGALFQRFPLDGSAVVEFHEFEDDAVWFARVDGDHLYVFGWEKASVVPLKGGDPIDSETWDGIDVLDFADGTLVAAGQDGSTQVLFSITAGADDDVEYDQYDDIASAQIYKNTVYASVTDDNDTDTIAYNLKTGDPHDDNDYPGYRLINTRQRTTTPQLTAYANAQPPQPTPEPADEPAAPAPDDTPAPAPVATEAPAPAPDLGTYFANLFGAQWLSLGDYRFEGIDQQGEVDKYIFEIQGTQTIIMETISSMDTFIELYEVFESGVTSSLYYDDDGGTDSSSRLDVTLAPGWYLLEVSGYDGTNTGLYELYIR